MDLILLYLVFHSCTTLEKSELEGHCLAETSLNDPPSVLNFTLVFCVFFSMYKTLIETLHRFLVASQWSVIPHPVVKKNTHTCGNIQGKALSLFYFGFLCIFSMYKTLIETVHRFLVVSEWC